MSFENLQFGDSGENVKILQEKLKILGYYNPVINGIFDIPTFEGVKLFQQENNLENTGIVNYETWKLLYEKTSSPYMTISIYPTLSIGSTGTFVKDLQTKLDNMLYYTGQINSNFDLETENAVKRFQYNNKLTATGIVNAETWNVINNLYGNLNDCAINNNFDDDNSVYTVKAGDTLYSIARNFNTTVDAIKSLNNLSSDILRVGQVLKIPTDNQIDNTTYTVVSGDTLYSIARKFNTTIDAIKSLNNLSSNILRVGQVLRIPTNNQNNYIIYSVKKGDTLYSIARSFNTTVDSIKSLNNLSSNILKIGQQLKILM